MSNQAFALPSRGALCICAFVLSPSIADAGWLLRVPTSFESGEPSSALGAQVALVDADGDGLDDLLLGAPGADGDLLGSGAVDLYWNTGTTFDAAAAWQVFGEVPYEHLGMRLAAVGDVDGDGFDDLVAAAPLHDGPNGADGVVRWFPGSATGLSGAAWTLEGAESGELGRGLAALGDVDGDGFDDFAIGEPGSQRVIIVFGGLEGPSDTVTLEATDAGFGWALAGGADLDGDGVGDLVVGAPFADAGGASERGTATVFSGASLIGGATPLVTLWGPGPGSHFGWAITLPGDVDGDGLQDLLVGAPHANGAFLQEGAALLHLGSTGGVEPVAAWAVRGGEAGAHVGAAMAGGDLDGDGVADLIIGAPMADCVELGGAVDGGRIDIHAGVAGGLPILVMARGGAEVDGGFGGSIATADLDADGYLEVVVGHSLALTGPGGTGAAHVFGGLDPEADLDDDGFCSQADPCHPLLGLDDCDDADPLVFPGAPERCNGVDDDCDGALDPAELDSDADGTSPCEGDCDDGDPAIGPDVPEVCDGVDHDCDGSIDNGVVPRPWFEDADLDGFGAIGDPADSGCDAPPTGYSRLSGDCDDLNHLIHPGADELTCNTLDDDCRSDTPDVPDVDGDGVVGCIDCTLVEPDAEGRTPLCGDCDDRDRGIGPLMDETCGDGIDQDCDGEDLPCTPPPTCDEPDNRCEEEGCSAVGRADPGGAALLCLLLVLLRRRTVLILAAIAIPSIAPAADGDVDTQLLRPSFAPHGDRKSTRLNSSH
jgi:hypothetical protein